MTRQPHQCDGEFTWCDDCEARERAKGRSRSTSTPDPAVGCDQRQTDAEWAASLSATDVELMLNACVKAKDMQGISAALHLLAVKDPNLAEMWRNTLLLAVEVGRARHEETP